MPFAFLWCKNADKASLTQTSICILRNKLNVLNSCTGGEFFTGKYFQCCAYGLYMNHTLALQRHDLAFFSAQSESIFMPLYMRGLPRALTMLVAYLFISV